MKSVSAESEATPRGDDEWYVDRRPLDVLLPHVPGFEVVTDADAEWKAIARTQEIGEQISRAVNSFDTLKRRVEKLEKALKPFAKAAGSWDIFRGEYLDSDSANNITVGDLRHARLALKGESQ